KWVFTGFMHDITQRQQAQLRLQDLQAEIAHVGRLSEMGTLASALAHELNQPLTAIASYCEGTSELLAGRPEAADLDSARDAVREAAAEAVRAGEIVRRMRNFMSHGQTEFRVEKLPQLVTEANALALVGSRGHAINVQVNLDRHSDRVLVDRVQIQQVLYNLIRNAIEAMGESPVRSLTIASAADSAGFVTVSVEDSGPGINETIAPELFQPFVTSKKSGMGIGLSICRTIVEAHGGRIWSEPGREAGAVFRFTLPIAGSIDGDLQ
ncbi:MAG: ATP-binding protein, partial [Sphingomicrobium sp.]